VKLSRVGLAGLAGRSESWLSQVERGKLSIDSYAVLTRMAEVLRVSIHLVPIPMEPQDERRRTRLSVTQMCQRPQPVLSST
jgi:transcriptional regulator with XRE-family HTH domain